ncbi:hypothetical protein VNO77_23216 [Canavalia gladiata]|uniref:Uncharacterized protein n=1 Tax=Canavalia gladiata TaxID=3824 RepID=A0AAN9L4X2_CANGL
MLCSDLHRFGTQDQHEDTASRVSHVQKLAYLHRLTPRRSNMASIISSAEESMVKVVAKHGRLASESTTKHKIRLMVENVMSKLEAQKTGWLLSTYFSAIKKGVAPYVVPTALVLLIPHWAMKQVLLKKGKMLLKTAHVDL